MKNIVVNDKGLGRVAFFRAMFGQVWNDDRVEVVVRASRLPRCRFHPTFRCFDRSLATDKMQMA
jgi:hypothetical protein